ncbi:hypothetical protein NPIL_365961 [Nephila pilipes]|uniref:Uncharacterized protein n=1 Tax=Nephila pilipes TaxID=299642 RepID=A0A8X6QB12_NEPPI|nr:hypothetical protein NPIL_365961 [Nephila pilipes]
MVVDRVTGKYQIKCKSPMGDENQLLCNENRTDGFDIVLTRAHNRIWSLCRESVRLLFDSQSSTDEVDCVQKKMALFILVAVVLLSLLLMSDDVIKFIIEMLCDLYSIYFDLSSYRNSLRITGFSNLSETKI